MMASIILVLILTYVVALIIGLIKPSLLHFPSRKTMFLKLTGGFGAVIISAGIVAVLLTSSSTDIPTTPVVAPSGPQQARTAGQIAYLRLPGNTDTSQALCLAPTKAIADKYMAALVDKNYPAILDLVPEGLFCVHNGTEVKVLSTTAILTKVEVVKGSLEIDSDKVGQSGYSAMEWVVDR